MVATAWVGLVGSWLISLVARWYLNARVVSDVSNARSLDEAVESIRVTLTTAVAVDVVTGVLISLGALVLIALMVRIERRSEARDAEIRAVAGV
jgi:ABC-type sulfate transport system permease component